MILTVPQDDALFPTLGPEVCAFIEQNLVFGPGDLRGQRVVLDDEKRALVYRMYEIYPKGHQFEGRRRFHRAGLSLAKGLAKTEFAALLAACELHPSGPVRCTGWRKKGRTSWEPVGGPVTDPYIPFVAYTEEQSDELAYGALRIILEESPLRSDFDIGLERIIRKTGEGKAVSLSSSPSARDGARTTFAVMDETHWWTLPRLRRAHQTMLNNLAKRRISDPWMLEVTTAPEPGTGSVAESTMEYAQAVAAGRVADSSLFYFHRQASDEHDLETIEGARAAVVEASGEAVRWRDIEAIVSLWADPTADRAFWERVWCNRLVKSSSQAFDVVRWKSLGREPVEIEPGALIVIGFDGAPFHDSTAIVCTDVATGYQWPAGLWECPFGVEGWQAPMGEIDDTVRALFERFTVWRLYADPPYFQSWIAQWRSAFGEERVIDWWTNRRRAMSAALEAFDTSMKEGEISHGGNPDFARHVGNARKDEFGRDENGRPLWVIRKERKDSPHKIDLAMAGVLSWRARMDAIASGALVVSNSGELFARGGVDVWV